MFRTDHRLIKYLRAVIDKNMHCHAENPIRKMSKQ